MRTKKKPHQNIDAAVSVTLYPQKVFTVFQETESRMYRQCKIYGFP